MTILSILFLIACSTTTALTQNLVQLQNVSEDVNRLKIELIRHFNCQHNLTHEWQEKIVFPSSEKDAQMLEDPDNPGCYKIGGDADIKSEIFGKLQMHIEMAHTVGQSYEIDECYQYDGNTGCGGFGTCLYCNVCGAVGDAKHSTNTVYQGAALWITHNGERIDCEDGLRLADYNRRQARSPNGEVSLSDQDESPSELGTFIHFCLPSTRQFLESRGITKQLWEDLSTDPHSIAIPPKIGIYLVIRLFETDVSDLVLEQYKAIESFVATKNGVRPTMDEMKLMPFNQEIWSNKGFIGCHKIVGNLLMDD